MFRRVHKYYIRIHDTEAIALEEANSCHANRESEIRVPYQYNLKTFSWTSVLMCLFCIICTCINVLQLDWKSVRPVSPSPGLRRIMSYNKTGNLTELATRPGQNVVFPGILAQVDRELGNTVVNKQEELYMSFNGGVVPGHMKFQITYNISTLAEFHMPDDSQDMERCAIVIKVPRNSTGSPGLKSAFGSYTNGAYELIGDTSAIEVWHVTPSARTLDTLSLTYNNKPARSALISSLYVAPGASARTHEFLCPAGSIQTFEFSCPWSNCSLSWYQSSHFQPLTVSVVQLPNVVL